MLRTALHDLERLSDISKVMARHGFDQIAEIVRGTKEGATRLTDKELVGAPRRFKLLLQDLGPTFIKLGQVLSTRPDIMPSAYITELKTLQNKVEPLDFAVISKAIQDGLGKPLDQVFARLDEKPLATASIAQVHRAELPDGRKVVVKVQRPGIDKTIRADVDLLYVLARLLDATIEESGLYRPVEIVKEFEKAIFEELDFLREARNAREFRRNFEDRAGLVFAEVVEPLTTRTVLVMEFLEGTKISEIDRARHDPAKAAGILIESFFRMVYEDGYFHGDPHPGNIMIFDDGRVALLDCGLVGRITKGTQDLLTRLSLAVAMKDADATARIVYRLGTPTDRVNLLQFRDEIQGLLDRYMAGKLDEMDAGSLITEMLDLSMRYRIRIPPDCAILAKAAVTIEGVVRGLSPDLDIKKTIEPYGKRLLSEQFGLAALGRQATKSALGLMDAIQDWPLQINQIVSDLESGRLTVRVSHDELNKLSRTFNDFGSKMFLGLLTCGLIVGSAFLLSRYRIEVGGVPILPIVGFIAALSIITIVFWWHVLYGRVKKIRLAFWLGLFRKRKGE
ncbi:MAG: AarF/ABC1/UbiB kinase family protein [Planctomycetes bacterium]|nr:AarF/ABC1/UbiB kinase family protein [Planctomycetota bacterium]